MTTAPSDRVASSTCSAPINAAAGIVSNVTPPLWPLGYLRVQSGQSGRCRRSRRCRLDRLGQFVGRKVATSGLSVLGEHKITPKVPSVGGQEFLRLVLPV